MKVIENFKDNYNEDPIRFWEFDEFAEKANDSLLFIGSSPELSILQTPSDLPKFVFSSEEQAWPIDGTDQYLPFCNTIFTICPPHVTGRQNRKSAFFPFNPKYTPTDTDKKYDVVYTGLASGPHIEHALNVMKGYNYRFVSFANNSGVTNVNASYIEKLQVVANTKISIIHNQTKSGPQLKSRPFEAGFCKTLMLVLRDEYNILEEWFTPDVDFIYYDNDNLKETLDRVLASFSDYQHIINNAYNRCVQEYTTERFIEKYIGFKNE